MTDGEGKFVLEKLDPALVFELLVVADGHAPQFTDMRTDPRMGEVSLGLERRDFDSEDPRAVLRGVVRDTDGHPIRRATLMPISQKLGDGVRFGPIGDPLAVTDEHGEFRMLVNEPGSVIQLQASANTYADRMSGWLTAGAGADGNVVTLDRGATVSGRVEQEGKPVERIEISLAQKDRDSSTFLGERTVGTDAAGRFTFVNVPASDSYWIYGAARSCSERGALSERSLDVGAVDSTAEAGVLALEPGVSLSGRVVSADGSALPEGTQLRLIREDVQDVMMIPVAADGLFRIQRVPRELVSLAPQLRTYRVSPVNASYDFVNFSGLIGRLENDTEIELVIEPFLGEQQVAMPDMAAWKRYEELMKSPLRGRVAQEPGKAGEH